MKSKWEGLLNSAEHLFWTGVVLIASVYWFSNLGGALSDALLILGATFCLAGVVFYIYSAKAKKEFEQSKMAAEEFRRSSLKGDS